LNQAMKVSGFRSHALFVFALHFLMQLAAWALADSAQGTKIPWRIVSFPLFYLLRSWATLYFWMVAVLNSILWALVSLGTNSFVRRKETP